MKKAFCVLFFLTTFSGTTLFCQSTASIDSVTSLLFKKWEVDYIVEGGRIDRAPETPGINLEFKKDKTVIITSTGESNAIKGTWNFEPKKKLIRLSVSGDKSMTVVSLKETEMTIVIDMKEAMPSDPTPLRMVCKPKL